jgi:4-hydroxybenzoate polyprenyltransferase
MDVADPREIFVDLDGTLLRTDLFFEAIVRYVRLRPWRIFYLPFVLMRGPAVAKAVLARAVRGDPARLPYEQGLIAHLAECKAEGCRIVLATAAHSAEATRIARHLGIFDGILATRRGVNLKGSRKLAEIQLMSEGRPFIYAGDSAADRPIWRAAESAIFVNAPSCDVVEAEQKKHVALSLETRPPLWIAFLRQMRLHQWAKNLLLFVPLLTSHRYGAVATDASTVAAFLAFGLCASGNYFINDLSDLDADRAHASKRRRPLASGDLPLAWGVFGAVALPALAFALSAVCLSWKFTAVLGCYFALSNVYSFFIKRISTADVFALALLYTVRVVAGAVAVAVVISSWLLAFSMFMFISLAYLKRYIEVHQLVQDNAKAKGRGYSGADADTMFSLGIANATAATVVLALYVSSEEVRALYRSPSILWSLCLLLLYWSNRIWVGARRGKINEDPVIFAVRDRVSRAVGVLALLCVLAARFV